MGTNSSNLRGGFAGRMNPNVPATIAISTTTSSTIPTGGMSLVGIQLPATLTSVSISFLASTTGVGGSFQPVYNAAGLVTYTVAGGRYISINPSDLQGIAFLQILCGSSEAAARTLVCSMKGI